MNRKAIIIGIKGEALSREESSILKSEKPWGIILFSRNINNYYQLKSLIYNIKNIFGNQNYPILIDQEGGKVSRLNKIINLGMFSQKYFGTLYKKDKKSFLEQYRNYIDKVSIILNDLGVNINTVPVLDVARKKTNDIIGSRSFSSNYKIVSKLGSHCIDFFKKNKIATVIKHIPGHGLARSDSHFYTPIVNSPKKELIKIDFKPFRACKSLFAMTAHIKYSSYDSHNVATQSKIVISDVIRKHIGFKGILISDDLSMKALKFSLKQNAIKSIEAGCNIVLHCNGNYKEIKKLLEVVPKIDSFIVKKTSQFNKLIG